ncbi:unnamed protein product [Staurois parvus]|uniref:Uncharacterized protein n=1 Tax=Staurois parvus TaxID=386267 RepID=A0ABN9CJ32_9NEOB|nr:unnamed protein product [Staurois parvus]
MTRDCGHSRGDADTADTVEEMTRDCGHFRGDDQTADTVEEMTRDCGHSRGDGQRLRTVQGWPETADSTGMARDCGQQYRR